MRRQNMQHSKYRVHRRTNAWVVFSSCAIAAFTVFVLLDAFAIERVQQSVQEADLSNIVATQEGEQGSDATEGKLELETPSPSDDTDSGTTGLDEPASDEAITSESAHRGPAGRYSGVHGGPAGESGLSGESGAGTHKSVSTNSASSSNGAILEEGAGSASALGTAIGSYSDDNMVITVSKVNAYDTDIYVADIQVSSAEYLKTALAQNAFGRNLKDTTSNMAEEAGAILAINGDYYGFRDNGYVVRNGVLYRDTAAAGTDALVVYGDGSMASASQDEVTAQQLVENGAWQVFSFGPTLVENGELAVTATSEVSQSMGSNPRTAIGMVSSLHYIVVASDGRTGDDAGLSLYQLAQVMRDNGATYAYNLDGGGSTTMWFQGEVLNETTSGNRDGERTVSDIVYFG